MLKAPVGLRLKIKNLSVKVTSVEAAKFTKLLP